MSYILDALRRADSERERGAVPGVHAQPVPLGSADAERPLAPRTWVWVSMALATVLTVLLAWQLLGGHEAAPPGSASQAPPPVQAITVPPPAIPVAPPPPVAAAPEPVPATPPAPTRSAEPRPAPAGPPVAMRPRNTVPAVTSLPGAAATATATPAQAQVATVAPAANPRVALAAVPPASAAPRIPTLNELPDDIQRGLPNLVVGGASYSQNPENRMLIVNGQVLREGDKVAPELTLEQIRLKEAVLSTKGHRYRIVY